MARPDPAGPAERIGARCLRVPLPDPFPPGVTSVFLLAGDDDATPPWLLDAGADAEGTGEAIAAKLAAAGRDLGACAGVILSHSHLDHAGGLRHWRPGIVAAHERCAAEMRNLRPRSSRGREALRSMGVPERDLESLAPGDSGAGPGSLDAGSPGTGAPLAGVRVDVELTGNRGEVPHGDGWEWILAEGHAPGHLMFFDPRDRLLLAGDQFLVRWKTPYRIADPDEDALGLYLASLAAALDLAPRTICSSHTEPVTPAAAWLEERRDAIRRQVERTRKAVGREPLSTWEVANALPAAPSSGGLRVLLLREQLAILRHLAAGGEIRSWREDGVERFSS